MKEELSKQKIDEVIKILDELIETENWDASNFLKVIHKNLREAREKFVNQFKSVQDKSKINSTLAQRVALRSGQQEVYIVLYSTEGTNIQSWERIVTNLPRQIISRPIYTDEEHVKEIIKTKENKSNEAYVSIFINQNDILPISADKVPIDKLGHPMLMLKDKSLNLNNINAFVHLTGVYQFSGGHLIKNNEHLSS